MEAIAHRLRLLLARVPALRAVLRLEVGTMGEQLRGREPEQFRQDEFASDPSGVMRRADTDGSVLITDDDGKPLMRISAPVERPLVLD